MIIIIHNSAGDNVSQVVSKLALFKAKTPFTVGFRFTDLRGNDNSMANYKK